MLISRFSFVLRQLYRITILNCINLLSRLIPSDDKLIIFGGWNGKKFIDNSKYLFIYFQSQHDGWEKIWITKDKKLCASINSQGYKAYYAYSIAGMIKQIRAKTVVFNQSIEVDFISCLIKLHNVRIQLWHGTPIKKIGYSDKFNIYSKRIMSISNFIIPFYNDRLDMCIAIGESDKNIYKEAFNVKESNVIITGYPRNDQFFNEKKKDVSENNKIIYLPTLRSDFSILSKHFFEEILTDEMDSLLNKFNYDLYIKLHPAQTLKEDLVRLFTSKKRIHFIIQDGEVDIYETITGYDALITDVSGVFFDLLLTDIKIYTYFPDNDHYIRKERELYYQVEDISVSEIFSNFKLLVTEILNDKYNYSRHELLKNKFHKYTDGNSSKRVYLEILKRIPN